MDWHFYMAEMSMEGFRKYRAIAAAANSKHTNISNSLVRKKKWHTKTLEKTVNQPVSSTRILCFFNVFFSIVPVHGAMIAPGCDWDRSIPRRAGTETSCWWVCEVHCGTGPRDVGWYWKRSRRRARLCRCKRDWRVPAASNSRSCYAVVETGDCAAAATSCKFPTKVSL